jgi:muconolactone delta-isomerase
MNSSTLRQLWSVVEETQTSTLLKSDDEDLIQQLLKQLENKIFLSSEEINSLGAYIGSRVPLIRDLAYARLA